MENTSPTPASETKLITPADGRTQTILFIFSGIVIFCAGVALGFTVKDITSHSQNSLKKYSISSTKTNATTPPTPLPTHNKSYTSKELTMSFQYPDELGEIHENIPTNKKDSFAWTIFFSGLNAAENEPGFIELIANSPLYQPLSWEGTQRWINDQITKDDTEESVKEKLIKSHYEVISVRKVISVKKETAFNVWLLDGQDATGYVLVRDYIFPVKNSQYTNLQLYSLLNNKVDRTLTKAKNLAAQQIALIEAKKADNQTQKYSNQQDAIFNSLSFTK